MYAYAYELDQKPDLGNDELDEIEKYFTIAAEHKHAQALYEKDVITLRMIQSLLDNIFSKPAN